MRNRIIHSMYIFDRRWRRLTLRPLLLSVKSTIHNQQSFSNVKSFYVFIGQPRSGTTLLSAILDAHPQIMVAQECNILPLLNFGIPKRVAFQTLYESALQFSRSGRKWNGYRYSLEDVEGKSTANIVALGLKHGSPNAKFFAKHPNGRKQLEARLSLPVNAIHLLRNPFDVIASTVNRRKLSINKVIDWYEELDCLIKLALGQFEEDQKLCIHLEDIISDPSYWLPRVSSFLGCPFNEKLTRNCGALVWQEPERTRKTIAWQPKHISRILRIISKNELLSRYTFESS